MSRRRLRYSNPIGRAWQFAKAQYPNSYVSLDNSMKASSLASNNQNSQNSFSFYNSRNSDYPSSNNTSFQSFSPISSLYNSNSRLRPYYSDDRKWNSSIGKPVRYRGSRRYAGLTNKGSRMNFPFPAIRKIASQPYMANTIQGIPKIPQTIDEVDQDDFPYQLPQKSIINQVGLPEELPMYSRVRQPFRLSQMARSAVSNNPISLSRLARSTVSQQPSRLSQMIGQTIPSLYQSSISSPSLTFSKRPTGFAQSFIAPSSIKSSSWSKSNNSSRLPTPTPAPGQSYLIPGYQEGQLIRVDRFGNQTPFFPDPQRQNLQQSRVLPFYPDQSRVDINLNDSFDNTGRGLRGSMAQSDISQRRLIRQSAPNMRNFYRSQISQPAQSIIDINLDDSFDNTRGGIRGSMTGSGFSQRKLFRQSSPVTCPPPEDEQSFVSILNQTQRNIENNDQIIGNVLDDLDESRIQTTQFNLKKQLDLLRAQNQKLKSKVKNFQQHQRKYWKMRKQQAWNQSVIQMLDQSFNMAPFERNIQFFTQDQHDQQDQFQKIVRQNRGRLLMNPKLVDHLIGIAIGQTKVRYPQVRILAQFILRAAQLPNFNEKNVNKIFVEKFFKGKQQDERQIAKMERIVEKQQQEQGFFKVLLQKDDVEIQIQGIKFPLPPS